jgi:hypothetical protein
MIHDLGDAFDHRNMFLQVALGMISMSRRFDELIEHYGTPTAGLPQPDGAADPALDFVLGLVSFSRTVRSYVDEARAEDGAARAPQRIEDATVARFDGLLR